MGSPTPAPPTRHPALPLPPSLTHTPQTALQALVSKGLLRLGGPLPRLSIPPLLAIWPASFPLASLRMSVHRALARAPRLGLLVPLGPLAEGTTAAQHKQLGNGLQRRLLLPRGRVAATAGGKSLQECLRSSYDGAGALLLGAGGK